MHVQTYMLVWSWCYSLRWLNSGNTAANVNALLMRIAVTCVAVQVWGVFKKSLLWEQHLEFRLTIKEPRPKAGGGGRGDYWVLGCAGPEAAAAPDMNTGVAWPRVGSHLGTRKGLNRFHTDSNALYSVCFLIVNFTEIILLCPFWKEFYSSLMLP